MPDAPVTLGYVRFLATNERLDFQYNPETIKLVIGATWNDRFPHGASHPRAQFQHADGRPIEVPLVFFARADDATDLDATRRLIESMPFPEYDGDGRLRSGPEPVVFVFGAWRTFRCTVRGVEIEPGPSFDPVTTRPRQLTVKLTLAESPASGDVSASDVRGGR